MLCDRRDRRWILDSGSLYNSGNHPERLPANRIRHSATHVSQFSCSKPTRRRVRLLLPHTHQATTNTNCFTIPSNWRQRGRSPELDTRQIPIQHLQHLRMPNTPSDGGPAVGTPRRPRGQADRSPQTHSNPSKVATGSESVYRQRCQTRGSGGCPRWRTRYLVPSNGHGSEKKRQATTHSWTCRCSTNMLSVKHITSNPPFTRRRWCLQGPRTRLPMLGTGIIVCQSEKKIATSPRWSRHGIGTDTKLVHRLRSFTGRIHQKVRRDCLWVPQQNQLPRWLMLIGRHSRRELLSQMSLARHLLSTRKCKCSESRKVCIWLRRGEICWFRHHSDRYPAQ